MEKHTPSHLAPVIKRRGARSRRGGNKGKTFCLTALAALLLFFLWVSVQAVENMVRRSGQDTAVAASASLVPSEGDQMDSLLAVAQANDIATALEIQFPTTLDEVEGVKVDLIPLNEYSRPGIPLTAVNDIVIHYVGNPGTTAQQNRDYYASLAITGEDSVSSHFVIGMDGQIIQCIPLDEKSYCTNHRNADTISIECCHPEADGDFTQETRESLIYLVRYLSDTFGLDASHVIRHYDVTGKACPKYYVEHEDAWNELKEDIFAH